MSKYPVALAAAALLATAAPAGAAADVVPSADGVPIAYEVHGDGPLAVVFVHGWSCDRSYWKAQLQPFARDFKVIAVDLAGHGESGIERKAWTIAAFGADVAAVMEKLGIQRAVLVGHSMGGDVIVEAARKLPGRVAGLVWVDVYKQLKTSRTPEQVQSIIAPFRANFAETTQAFVQGMFPPGADRALVERVSADMSAAPPEIALAAMQASLSNDREMPKALQELKLPVVAINPDSPPTDLVSMERNGVEVLFMFGVGHFPMMEGPGRFNLLLRKAIRKMAPR
jgi:pimeloyl-ACP methyl ester carboxylesterase